MQQSDLSLFERMCIWEHPGSKLCVFLWQAKKDNLGGLQDEQARLKAEYDRMEVHSCSPSIQSFYVWFIS